MALIKYKRGECMKMALNCLKVGQSGTVVSVNAKDAILRRLLDIGIIEGTRVSCVLKSPSGDPIAYLIRGAVIAIRNEDSSEIVIEADSPIRGVEKYGTYCTVGR